MLNTWILNRLHCYNMILVFYFLPKSKLIYGNVNMVITLTGHGDVVTGCGRPLA